MNHAQAIYESIPKEIKKKFEFDVIFVVNRLITEIEAKLPNLTSEQQEFFKALGSAGNYHAVYEAFGKVLADE
jgi:hypothetical protein